MKSLQAFLGGLAVAVCVGIFAVSSVTGLLSEEKSVEFGIAEVSPAGASGGYAMPASGGSAPSSTPGCNVTSSATAVPLRTPVSMSWQHGTVSGTYTGATSSSVSSFGSSFGTRASGYEPENAAIVGGLSPWGVNTACLAYCNLATSDCNPRNTRLWSPVNIRGNSGTLSYEENLPPSVASLLGVAHASGGSRACNNARAVTKSFNLDTSKPGYWAIGMRPTYSSTYGSHHTASAAAICYVTLKINPLGVTTGIVDLNPFLPMNKTIQAYGDLTIEGIIRNLGNNNTATAASSGGGSFNYTLQISQGTASFVRADQTYTGTVSALAGNSNTVISQVIAKANVQIGLATARICVDTGSVITESSERNNCDDATFEVVEPDLAAYAIPGVFYSVYGETLTLFGSAYNKGRVAIRSAFNNSLDIKVAGAGASKIFPVNQVNGLVPVGQGVRIANVSPIDMSAEFGTARNFEYRWWVDSTDLIDEVSPDNVRPDTNGNNDSAGWARVQLVNPDVQPRGVDQNGSAPDFYGPFVYNTPMQFEFAIENTMEEYADIKSSFRSMAGFDTDGDCPANPSDSDACFDYTTYFTTNGVPARSSTNSRVSVRIWEIGTHKIKVFADVDNTLKEDIETDNVTGWLNFTVVEFLPGGRVDLIADPQVLRKGAAVDLSWDIGTRDPATCKIVKNQSTVLLATLPRAKSTVPITDVPTSATLYMLECEASNGLGQTQDTEQVNVLPNIYES